MDPGRQSGHVLEDASDSEACAVSRCPSPKTNYQAKQDLKNVHFSGNSRTHIGNVYNNNNYTNIDLLDSATWKETNLMATLAFNGMQDRRFEVSPAYVNTCNWFLHTKEYTQWRDPVHRYSHNGILWIKGKAGTGKSTLMRYIHDHALNASKSAITISFFFHGRSQEPLLKSTEGMYRSLLHQLYDNVPRLKKIAAQRITMKKSQSWSLGILKDLFLEAVLDLNAGESTDCYIDALDECADDQVRSAIESFECLSQSTTHDHVPFFMCFSSRYYPKITIQTHVESRLDDHPQHMQDIAEYLNNCLTIPPAMKREFQTEIEDRCSGIFLWVVLVVRIIKESIDQGATRRQVHENLDALPSDLHALFARISETADAGFVVAMRWVLSAETRLSPEHLYFAVQNALGALTSAHWDESEVGPDTIKSYILHVSRGLIECREIGKEVQFVHESVRGFLLSGSLADLAAVPRHTVIPSSHAMMAAECNRYLGLCVHGQRSMATFEKVADVHEGWVCGQGIGDRYPLSRYAVGNTFKHIDSVCSHGSPTPTLFDFSVSDYVTVRRNFQGVPREFTRHVPGHSAILLMILIESEHHELAKYILDCAFSSRIGSGDYVGRFQARTLALSNTKATHPLKVLPPAPDLATCCGGLWGSPLHAAVQSGNYDLVRLLLSKGASPSPSQENCRDIRFYGDPLVSALEYGSIDMIRVLLDFGADANAVSPLTGLSPLHTTCLFERYKANKIVNLLLSHGANVNLLTRSIAGCPRESRTALHMVVSRKSKGTHRVLRELLQGGADVNALDSHDRTPLIIATHSANIEAVKMLLFYGANAEYRSTWHGTAVAAADPLILAELLLEIRLRALAGRDTFLPLANTSVLQGNRRRQGEASRISFPVRSSGQRAKISLAYRRLPQRPQLVHDDIVEVSTPTNGESVEGTETETSGAVSRCKTSVVDYGTWDFLPKNGAATSMSAEVDADTDSWSSVKATVGVA